MKTKVRFLHENATFKKAHDTDSGFDLTACGYEYKENGLWHIKLGVEVEPPKGFYFEVAPRSSFSKTSFTFPNNLGIIDQSYRGEWRFPIRHTVIPWFRDKPCNEFFHVNGGFYNVDNLKRIIQIAINGSLLNRRIAQAILRPYITSEIEIVETLSETERGRNGFGSSGE